jgi:hypothetical protein
MQDALDALIAILDTHYEAGGKGGAHKIAQRFAVPPEASSDYPFAVAFVRSGKVVVRPVGVKRGLDTLVLQIHQARTGALDAEIKQLMFYSDDIPMLILNDPNLGGSVDVVNEIRYTFGLLDWGGQQKTIGWEFEIDVKRLATLSDTVQQWSP